MVFTCLLGCSLKYIAVNKDGSLVIQEMNRPNCQFDEVVVQVKAIGINRADILQRQGKYPAPKGESEVLGIEVCGDIVSCGASVKHWSIGDKVFSLVAGGGYAEYVIIKANHLLVLPDDFSYQQGAAVAEVFLTAYQSLFLIGKLKPREKVLVHAGASGVGCAAIQLAKAKACYVVVTVSSSKKAEACLKLGADEVIIYTEQDFVGWTKQQKFNGFDVILDVVAGNYLSKNINCAALDARIVILSMLGGRFAEQVDIAKLLLKRVTITASTLRNRSDEYKANLVTAFIEDFYPLLENKKIVPVLDTVLPWQEVEAAHQKMLNNKNIGKLILNII